MWINFKPKQKIENIFSLNLKKIKKLLKIVFIGKIINDTEIK